MPSTLLPVAISASLLGPLSHYLFWAQYEFDTKSHIVVLTFFLFPAFASAFLSYKGFLVKDAVLISFTSECCYVVSLFVSIIIYRLYLHPLCKYPGQKWAKVTQFWRIKAMNGNDTRGYLTLHKLHEKYGDVVRVGPRVLSINNVEALQGIYGSSSQCTKLSSLEKLRKNLQSIRGKDEHRARRHVWEQALNAKVCQEYLPRMNDTVSVLISQLLKTSNAQSVSSPDLNKMMRFFVFDIISEIGFGQSYSQLTTQEPFPAIEKTDKFLSTAITAIQVIWLLNIIMRIPGLEDPGEDMRQWAFGVFEARQQSEKKRIEEVIDDEANSRNKDVISFIYHKEDNLKIKGSDARWPLSMKDIAEDAVTLQIAGSDTSYSLIMHLLFYLADRPSIQQKIREEASSALLKGTTTSQSELDIALPYQHLSSSTTSPYLEAAIQETLRLHPPVPQGQERISPSDHSIEIAGYVIPPSTVISARTWSIQRDSRYWKEPNTWIPERWIEGHTARDTLVLDRRAFAPFSLGGMNCVGRHLAIMEVKLLIARLLLACELRPALCPDDMSFEELIKAENALATERHNWMNDQKMLDEKWLDGSKDYITMWVPELKLKLKKLDS